MGAVLVYRRGGNVARARGARKSRCEVRRQGKRNRVRHGVRHQQLHHTRAHGQRFAHHQRQPEPPLDRLRSATQRRACQGVPPQRRHASREGAASRHLRRTATNEGTVEEDSRHRRGHLQHGGSYVQPARNRRDQEEVRRLSLPRRGALHRRHGRVRARRLRAPGNRHCGRGHHDGNVHQVIRIMWRLHCLQSRRDCSHQAPLAFDAVRRLDERTSSYAGSLRARDLNGRRRLARRTWPGEDCSASRQRKLLPRAAQVDGMPDSRRRGQSDHAAHAVQSEQDCGIQSRVLQAWRRSGGGWLSRDRLGGIARAFLLVCSTLARRPRRGTRGCARGVEQVCCKVRA
mmetsp:Transcript_5947/g.13610  ORF Transcript_5947/g.13610 Transcript_5947/m.13610 type:complete len:344 (+) Transcript_5947:579-1610(+)